MPRISNTEKLKRIHETARKQFDRIQSVMREERKQCLEDRRFYSIAGAQWEGSLKDQFANRMRFEFNKVHLAVIRIINEYRNNRINVTFVSKPGEDNTENSTLPDACAGLFRADYIDSGGEEATDNAFEEAAGGGFGAFRLCNEYEYPDDDEDDRQRVAFKAITDADSCVFFDLDAKRQDKRDANFCFVLTPMAPETFTEEYGSDPASWPKEVHSGEFDWATPDVIFVAEYYLKEKQKETVVTFKGLDDSEQKFTLEELDADLALANRLKATGFTEHKRRECVKQRVHKYIMSGLQIEEDAGLIAGPNIPIIPVYGKRWVVDGVERCMGAVRLSKDPARLKNIEVSKIAEIAAASSYEKPILSPEQVAGFQTMWEEEPVKNFPYLLLNPITDASGQQIASGPIAYTKPPQVPPAMAALVQLTDADQREILGSQQQGEQMVSNISSRAVEQIQERLDMQSYIYVSNMAKALKRAGEVWLGMAAEVYVEEERKLKTIGESDEVDVVELLRPVIDTKTGGVTYQNDLARAHLDVAADVGPASSSRRKATVTALKEVLTAVRDPETANVLSSMIMMNIEGEGVQDARDFFRQRLIRMGAVKPTEKEAQALAAEMQNKQPSPMDQYALAEADKAQALATKAKADTLLAITTVDEKKAKILEILAGIDAADREQVIRAAELAARSMPAAPSPVQEFPVPQAAAGGAAPAQP